MTGAAKDWQARLAWELRAARRLTVLGVGNPDRGDDGAGSVMARQLRKAIEKGGPRRPKRPAPMPPPGPARCFAAKGVEAVQILDGGEVPESVTGPIRKFCPTHVLIIDAAAAGNAPGTIFFINKKRIPEDDLTTHRIPLSHLARYLEETVRCRVILVGIEPVTTAAGATMSSAVKAAVTALVSELANFLPTR